MTSIHRVYQNLSYEVVITCPPGESWPRLVRVGRQWEIVQVEIRVAVYVGGAGPVVLDTGPAYITGGHLVRADGSPGREASHRAIYAGTGEEGDAVDVQALVLDQVARRVARNAYRQFITAEAERIAHSACSGPPEGAAPQRP